MAADCAAAGPNAHQQTSDHILQAFAALQPGLAQPRMPKVKLEGGAFGRARLTGTFTTGEVMARRVVTLMITGIDFSAKHRQPQSILPISSSASITEPALPRASKAGADEVQREQEQAHADTAADEEPGDGPGDGGVVVEPVHVGCKGPPALRKEAEPEVGSEN
ncbi:MAG: hypothetical protein CYPHOPRED_001708 [Cyphobasidiales sp. Tagirdzhanova-0007]|nr:MAG: hypothetical protein CYPHOPRED_001708 [Cyphobasidiales sp. Tagirdzhanova-0007]